MRTVKTTLIAVLLVGVLTIGFASVSGLESLGRASAAPTSPMPGIGLLRLGGTLGSVPSSNGYSIVIGDSSQGAQLAGLPGTSLAYFSGTDVNTQFSTGVPYTQAAGNGWLLKSSSGNLLVNQGYTNDYIGDVGNPSYQSAWITNVLAYLASYPGLKGVYIDEVLDDLAPITGVEAAKYPTQQAWGQAELSFINAAGTALRSHGYYVLVNADGYIPGNSASNDGSSTVAWWQQLGPYVSGLATEYYQQISDGTNALRSTGPAWSQAWDGWQALIDTAQAMGKDFIGITYGPAGDSQTLSYGRASFLMGWGGAGGAFIYQPTDGSDPTNTSLTTNIGQPLAAKQQVGTGWMRQYSSGVALVNTSGSSSQSFQLPGTYITPSGASVTAVTLGPTSGMILRATAATANALVTTTPAVTTTTPAVTTTTPAVTTTSPAVTTTTPGVATTTPAVTTTTPAVTTTTPAVTTTTPAVTTTTIPAPPTTTTLTTNTAPRTTTTTVPKTTPVTTTATTTTTSPVTTPAPTTKTTTSNGKGGSSSKESTSPGLHHNRRHL